MFNSTFLAEDFRKISNQLNSLTEDNEIDSTTDEISTDKTIDKLLTKEKSPDKLAGSVDVKSLAKDLGLENVSAFQAAFSQLKQGKMPTSSSQIKELAFAFDRLLSADASTTSRILTKLRQIHKA